MFRFKISLAGLLLLGGGGGGAWGLPAAVVEDADANTVAANSHDNTNKISSSSSSSFSSRSAPESFRPQDLVSIHRRHLDLLQRLLQDSSDSSSSTCQAEADAVMACLETKVAADNATEGAECFACYNLKQEEALDDFRNNPTFECPALNENVCRPVSECSCLEPCDDEISASVDCQLEVFNCTISCEGTNVTTVEPEDDFTANDNFVGGLCAGEEAGIKLCLETMGSSLEACSSCLATTGQVTVTNATTCGDLQANTCARINACPCVEDCKTEMVAYWNCEIDFSLFDVPELKDCNQVKQCPSSSTASGAPVAAGASWRRFITATMALGGVVEGASAFF